MYFVEIWLNSIECKNDVKSKFSNDLRIYKNILIFKFLFEDIIQGNI
jgi:hypothetical protein